MKQCKPCCLVVFDFRYVDDAATVASDTDHDFFFERGSVFAASESWIAIGSRRYT